MVDTFEIAQIETRLRHSSAGRHDTFNMARLRLVMLVIVFAAVTAGTAASIQPYPTARTGATVVAALD